MCLLMKVSNDHLLREAKQAMREAKLIGAFPPVLKKLPEVLELFGHLPPAVKCVVRPYFALTLYYGPTWPVLGAELIFVLCQAGIIPE